MKNIKEKLHTSIRSNRGILLLIILFFTCAFANNVSAQSPNLNLTPSSGSSVIGQINCWIATVTQPNGQPLVGVPIQFIVLGGPNAGISANAISSNIGQAQFCYN